MSTTRRNVQWIVYPLLQDQVFVCVCLHAGRRDKHIDQQNEKQYVGGWWYEGLRQACRVKSGASLCRIPPRSSIKTGADRQWGRARYLQPLITLNQRTSPPPSAEVKPRELANGQSLCTNTHVHTHAHAGQRRATLRQVTVLFTWNLVCYCCTLLHCSLPQPPLTVSWALYSPSHFREASDEGPIRSLRGNNGAEPSNQPIHAAAAAPSPPPPPLPPAVQSSRRYRIEQCETEWVWGLFLSWRLVRLKTTGVGTLLRNLFVYNKSIIKCSVAFEHQEPHNVLHAWYWAWLYIVYNFKCPHSIVDWKRNRSARSIADHCHGK